MLRKKLVALTCDDEAGKLTKIEVWLLVTIAIEEEHILAMPQRSKQKLRYNLFPVSILPLNKIL